MGFYKIDTKNIYFFLTLLGIIMIVLTKKISFNKKDTFIIWFTFIKVMFISYGTLFLRKGIYNFDIEIFRYITIVFIYIGFYKLLKNNRINIFFNIFIYSFIFIITIIILKEGNMLISKGFRLGSMIAGNSNTTAIFFGIELTVFMWGYLREKKNKFIVLIFLSTIFIALTGSKKGIIIILLNVLFYFMKMKKSKKNLIILSIIIFIFIYLIFFNEYFYNIIGNRIESMLSTLKGDGKMYSYSTEERKIMIEEGWKIFLETPILGGGYNNFYANTTTLYDYSHCNYIELLCSFGILGTLLYYSQYLKIFFMSIKKMLKKNYSSKNLFIFILCLQVFLLDFFQVSFSGIVNNYLPIILASILIKLK